MARTIDLRKSPTPELPKNRQPFVRPVVVPPKHQDVTAQLAVPSAPNYLSWTTLPYEQTWTTGQVTIFTAGIGALAALVWYLQRDLVFTALLLVVAVSLIFLSRRKHKPLAVKLTTHSITVDDAEYKLRDIKSFWIDYTSTGIKELSLETNRWYLTYLKIPLADQDPLAVRDSLILQVPEQEHQISLIEAVARLVKF